MSTSKSREHSDSRDRKRKKEKKEKRDKRDKEDKKKKKKDKHRKRSYSRDRSYDRDRRRDHKRRSRSRDRDRNRRSPKRENRWGDSQGQGGMGQVHESRNIIQPQQGQEQQQEQQKGLGTSLAQLTQQNNGLNQELNAQNLLQRLQVVRAQQELATSKADRKIYVGNIPTHITTAMLTQVMNQALKQMQINQDPPGDSIVSSWISPDAHYAFIEFRTPEEATRGLNALSQGDIKLYQQAIKFGRPKQYIQQTTAIESSQNTTDKGDYDKEFVFQLLLLLK